MHLDPDWSAGYGALPSDVHGVAVTYQQVAANPRALRRDGRAARWWCSTRSTTRARAAPGAMPCASPSSRRCAACACRARRSARTRARSRSSRYEGDLASADYEYGYGEALGDRAVVRPVYFPRIDGHMEWTAPGGLEYAATFDDPLTRELANQRLRTALNAEGRVAARGAGAGARPAACTCGRATRAPPGWSSPWIRSTRAASRRSCTSAWRVDAGRRHLGRSGGLAQDRATSRRASRPGSWRCAWSRRGSTSRACASASTPPTP